MVAPLHFSQKGWWQNRGTDVNSRFGTKLDPWKNRDVPTIEEQGADVLRQQ